MELLLDPPPAYEGIAKAFAMAKQLPTTHRHNVQVGLTHEGVLFARGTLDGYRQVSFFAEHVLGGSAEMFDCDMLFSAPAEAAVREDDPSFIRRPAMELWPARSTHADH